MELVYIWVEKYKNIRLKGFNLSLRFDCQYEPNKLIIKRKKYLKIFSKNIDITAFIGTNGSGKTSLLEIIQLLCLDSVDVSNKDEHIWGVFYDNTSDKFYCDSLINENIGFHSIILKDINDNDITKHYELNRTIEPKNNNYYFYNIPKNTFYNICYNPSIELVSSKFLNYIDKDSQKFFGHIFDLDFKPSEINIFAFPSKDDGIINIKKNENTIILNMFKVKSLIENIDMKSYFESKKLIFIPKRISFEINFNDLEYNIKADYIREIVLQNQLTLNIEDLHRYYIAMIFSAIKILKYQDKGFTEYFLKDESIIKKYIIGKYNKIQADYTDYNVILKIIYEEIYNNIDEFIELTKDISLFDSLVDNSKLNFNVNEISKLIDTMKKHNIKTFPSSTSEIDKILILLKNLPSFIDVKVYDESRALFNDFSYGEKNIIQLLYSLLYYITLFEKDKVLNIILDEIELGLNPKWQKELMNILLKLLSIDMFSNIKFNIFLSSHSPFILSDIPKSNVLFLKDGGQDLVSFKNKETFGANIHTLLSHGFFMGDGLMGKFARNTIDKIIRFLNGGNKFIDIPIHEIKSIVNLIGEEFLKVKLLDMYYKKFDNEFIKEQRKQELLKLKEKIEKELKKL